MNTAEQNRCLYDKSDLQTFLSDGHICYYRTVRGADILRNVIVSGYVTFYQFNKILVICFHHLTKWLRGPHLAHRP